MTADPASGELIIAVIQRSNRENQVNLAQLQERLFSVLMLVTSLSLLAVMLLARAFWDAELELVIELNDFLAREIYNIYIYNQ